MFFINLKTHPFTLGKFAQDLAALCLKIKNQTNIPFFLVPQTVDLKDVSKIIPCFAQHIDFQEAGAHTGYITSESVKNAGAEGVVLNHAEHRLPFEILQKTIMRAKEQNLKTLVCASSLEELKKISELKPNFLAYEPPELIGSKSVSVSQAKPEAIKEASLFLQNKNIVFLIGAGIKTKEDVEKGLLYGAEGFFVSSSIIKSPNIEETILSFVEPFLNRK